MGHRTRTRALLALPQVALLAVALPGLGAPMWRDEAASWAFSSLGYGDLVTATGHVDRVFLPYYTLVRTLRLAGLDVAGVRAASLLAAAGTVVAVQLIARKLWSDTAGLLAGLALVLNPAFVVTALSLRPYSLATFLSAVATWLVVRRPQHLPLRVRWWSYLAAITAAAHLHLFSATVAVPHLVWLRLRVPRRVLPVAWAWAIALALTAPLAIGSARQSGQVGWITTPTFESTIHQAALATGSDLYYLGAGTLTVVAVVMSALLGVLVAARRHRPDPSWLLAVLLWLWPVLALTALSFLASPVAIARYFLTTAIGAALLIGYGASVVRHALLRSLPRVGNRTLVAAIVSATVVALVPSVVYGRPRGETLEGHPSVDRLLAATVRPGDVLAFRQGMSETGFAYGFARELGDDAFEHDAVRALVTGQPPVFLREVVAAGGTVTTRATDGRGARRVWLIALDDAGDPAGIGRLGRCTPDAGPTRVRQTAIQRLACTP